MKKINQKHLSFIGKSLLWSLLLYVFMMTAFNWDDISKTISGQNGITVINHVQPGTTSSEVNPAQPIHSNIAEHSGVLKNAINILKAFSGISNHAPH